MIATLSELAAPLSEAEFRALQRDSTVRLVRGAHAGWHPIDWEGFKAVVSRPDFPVDTLRLRRGAKQLSQSFYTTAGLVDAVKLDAMMAKGMSAVAYQIERYVPALAELCLAIETRTQDTCSVGVVATTGEGGAFANHYDPQDLTIVQLEGTKRWRIFGPRSAHPVTGMKMLPPGAQCEFDEILQPGDMLLLPAGAWHLCENGPGLSLHLAVFFEPLKVWHAASRLFNRLMNDEAFRQPLTRLTTDERAALETELKRKLMALSETLSLEEFLAAYRAKKDR
ncbi:MAG: hypothetical protein JSR60_19490 [Proteobacteria bacterium]|nr:hypothetical protein [Pseudomonadota bacterium]